MKNWRLAISKEIPKTWHTGPAMTLTGNDSFKTRIKFARGEKHFICVIFLCKYANVIDGAESYDWVKYIYIGRPHIFAQMTTCNCP